MHSILRWCKDLVQWLFTVNAVHVPVSTKALLVIGFLEGWCQAFTVRPFTVNRDFLLVILCMYICPLSEYDARHLKYGPFNCSSLSTLKTACSSIHKIIISLSAIHFFRRVTQCAWYKNSFILNTLLVRMSRRASFVLRFNERRCEAFHCEHCRCSRGRRRWYLSLKSDGIFRFEGSSVMRCCRVCVALRIYGVVFLKQMWVLLLLMSKEDIGHWAPVPVIVSRRQWQHFGYDQHAIFSKRATTGLQWIHVVLICFDFCCYWRLSNLVWCQPLEDSI